MRPFIELIDTRSLGLFPSQSGVDLAETDGYIPIRLDANAETEQLIG
jgi:hypothetical protein